MSKKPTTLEGSPQIEEKHDHPTPTLMEEEIPITVPTTTLPTKSELVLETLAIAKEHADEIQYTTKDKLVHFAHLKPSGEKKARKCAQRVLVYLEGRIGEITSKEEKISEKVQELEEAQQELESLQAKEDRSRSECDQIVSLSNFIEGKQKFVDKMRDELWGIDRDLLLECAELSNILTILSNYPQKALLEKIVEIIKPLMTPGFYVYAEGRKMPIFHQLQHDMICTLFPTTGGKNNARLLSDKLKFALDYQVALPA